MKVSISRSVSRAFDLLEVFRETRKPASATEIRRRLGCPHSSAVAVLHNLVDLGYLSYDNETKLFFPSRKFAVLGSWVQPALNGSGKLRELVDAITLDTGHSSAISCRNSIFLNNVYVRNGHHPCAHKIGHGIDFALGKSIPGIAILSQLKDVEIADSVSQANQWSARARANQICDIDQVMDGVAEMRSTGGAIGLDWSCDDISVIALPLISPFDGSPLCISTIGPTKLLKSEAGRIRRVMEHYLRLHSSGAPKPWPPAVVSVRQTGLFVLRRPPMPTLRRAG